MNKRKKEVKKGWTGEIRGLVYIAISLILFASLITYSPDDPSLNSVSTKPVINNVVGLLGSYLSDILFSLFGSAAYLFSIVLLFTGWKRLKGEENPLNPIRIIGFILLFLAIPTFLQIHFERIFVSINGGIPAGGLLGNILSSALFGCCAVFGTHVITFTLVLISIVLATGVAPHRMANSIWDGLNKIFSFIKSVILWKRNRKEYVMEAYNDADEDIASEQLIEANPLSIPSIVDQPRIVEKISSEKIPPHQEHFEFMDITPDGTYKLPPLAILSDPPPATSNVNKEDLLMNSNILEKKLLDFGIDGQIVQVHPGPVITMYEFEPAPGVKLSKIVNLSDDLALAMKSGSVRIVAPIPGRSTVGLEVPNNEREDVYLKEIISSEAFRSAKSKLTLALGRDISGNPVVADLTKMPHLLVAGATGSGKSVALNSMISSLLFNAAPSDLKMVMIDPKILELSTYEGAPHLLTPVITQPKEASWVLQKLVEEMQKRYRILAEKGVRNIDGYNKIVEAADALPYIVVIIDELADLMMTAQREVEDSIARLAQMARAAGIHLIVATQRPSVDVLTGVIKANFPARISFKVSSKIDSRTILDANGAENLLDKGDMLFLPPGTSKLSRIHGAFITEAEVRKVVDYIRMQGSPDYSYKIQQSSDDSEVNVERDEYYQQALDLVLSSGQASISLIQRRLRIGFNRAARLVELMEEDGYVGPATGGKPREVIKGKDVQF